MHVDVTFLVSQISGYFKYELTITKQYVSSEVDIDHDESSDLKVRFSHYLTKSFTSLPILGQYT